MFGFKRNKKHTHFQGSDIAPGVKSDQAQTCFHQWATIDVNSDVDQWSSWTNYTLGCRGCGATKSVDDYNYELMRRKGLVN